MRARSACAALALLFSTSARLHAQSDAEPSTPLQQAAVRPTVAARLSVGAGLAQRSIRVPTGEGTRALDTGFVAAASLGLNARWHHGRAFVGARLGYQTTLAVDAVDTVPDGTTPSPKSIRSHRFEGGLAPGFYLAAGPESSSLSLLIGYAVRAFGSTELLRIPRYSLHGPLLRLAFDLPLFGGRVEVRVAPEAHAIISETSQLRAAAGIGRFGLAYGGEASVRVRIDGPWAARLCYRESRLSSPGVEGLPFQDIERSLWLELSFRYE